MSYLIIVFLLGLLILAHEAGHLFAAKLVKIPIARFSIGMGPGLFKWKKGDVEYMISWIPFGGYVLPAIEDESEFFNIPVGRRIIFSLGGPIANFIFCIILFGMFNLLNNGFSFFGITFQPFIQTGSALVELLMMIPKMFGQPDQLTGIVGIVAIGGQYTGLSLIKLINFSIMLNLNLAIFNLLPFPPLDGGKIVLSLLEKINIKSKKLFYATSAAGAILLITLLVYATYQDICRLMA